MSKDTHTKRLRIGVFMGGKSVEREVSFNSGRTVCDHIDISRYEVVPLFQLASGEIYILPLKFLHRGKIADFESRLSNEATSVTWDDLKNRVDFMYIAVHGRYAEDGTLQGMLEVLGIPYLGSKVFASACGINKVFQKKLMEMRGVSVAKGVVLQPGEIKNISNKDILARLEKANITLPCVVKPAYEGSSLGISVVFGEKDLIPALQNACWKQVTRVQPVLIEEKVGGMEFTCIGLRQNQKLGLISEKYKDWFVLPITEVLHDEGTYFHDYEQKYMPGRSKKITPARCAEKNSEAIKQICVQVADLLGFETFFRIDGFLTQDKKVIITDPNTLSGMGPASFLFHQAAEIGMSHTHLIDYVISCELDNYNMFDDVMLFEGIGESVSNVQAKNKKRVVVLLGGASNEREVSLESGRNVCYKLSPSKYEVIPIFVDEQMNLFKLSPRLLIQNSTKEIEAQVSEDIKIQWDDLPKICDFVFIALHGGRGENGSVQGALEMLGLAYNGPGVLASSLCMDKYRTNKFLQEQGFDVPKSHLMSIDEWHHHNETKTLDDFCDSIESELGFPLILKPHDDGCSVHVEKIDTKENLKIELQKYFATKRNVALLEECLNGMELTCGLVGNDDVTVLPPSWAVASAGVLSMEEKFLPGAGENQTPAPLPEKAITFVQNIVKETYVRLGCKGYSRIDCFYQDAQTSPTGCQRVVILEVNTLPALTPATCLFHQAAEVGIKPMELIDTIVELGIQNHKTTIEEKKVGVRKET